MIKRFPTNLAKALKDATLVELEVKGSKCTGVLLITKKQANHLLRHGDELGLAWYCFRGITQTLLTIMPDIGQLGEDTKHGSLA